MEAVVHPVLNLPYGKWIVMSWQVRSGSIWQKVLTSEQIGLIEHLAEKNAAWIMLRRVDHDDYVDNERGFERMCYLRRPK